MLKAILILLCFFSSLLKATEIDFQQLIAAQSENEELYLQEHFKGPHAVGTFTGVSSPDNRDGARSVPYRIWFPMQGDSGWLAWYHMISIRWLPLFKRSSFAKSQPVSMIAPGNWPVFLYSASLTAHPAENYHLMELLASHGIVVIAVGPHNEPLINVDVEWRSRFPRIGIDASPRRTDLFERARDLAHAYQEIMDSELGAHTRRNKIALGGCSWGGPTVLNGWESGYFKNAASVLFLDGTISQVAPLTLGKWNSHGNTSLFLSSYRWYAHNVDYFYFNDVCHEFFSEVKTTLDLVPTRLGMNVIRLFRGDEGLGRLEEIYSDNLMPYEKVRRLTILLSVGFLQQQFGVAEGAADFRAALDSQSLSQWISNRL